MNKVPLTFDMLSALDYAVEFWRVEEHPVRIIGDLAVPLEVLAVAFRGDYAKDGGDSAFMEGVIGWGLLAWEAHGLVLDFRGLAYGSGDRMQNVLNTGFARRGKAEQLVRRIFGSREPDAFPTAVIVSDQCRAGLESLIAEQMQEYAGALVVTEEEAIRYVAEQWGAAEPSAAPDTGRM